MKARLPVVPQFAVMLRRFAVAVRKARRLAYGCRDGKLEHSPFPI
jgi:hypothetical protein